MGGLMPPPQGVTARARATWGVRYPQKGDDDKPHPLTGGLSPSYQTAEWGVRYRQQGGDDKPHPLPGGYVSPNLTRFPDGGFDTPSTEGSAP